MNRILYLASSLTLLCSGARAATLNATPANVGDVVRGAKAGDVVQLQSGQYDLRLYNVKKSGEVVITPAPGATVTTPQISADGSSNLTFRGITVPMPVGAQYGIEVLGATNVTLDGLTVKGANCAKLAGVGAWFRELPTGANVTLKNSKFSCLGSGVGAMDVDGLKVIGNDFQKIGTDGVIESGSTNAQVSNNTFGAFDNRDGGHPDAVQFADHGKNGSAHVTITGNHFERGSGDPAQGVFVEDGSDFTICGNALQGTMYNGISLARTKGAKVCDNFVQPYPDQTSWIMVRQQADGVTVTNNAAGSVVVGVANEPQPTKVTKSGNTATRPAPAGDQTQYKAWLARH